MYIILLCSDMRTVTYIIHLYINIQQKPVQHITRSASTVESPEKPNISSVGKSLSDNVVMAPSEAECGPNNSTSEIYSPDDEDHKEFDEPDHPCELDSYEHPGKDMSENDESDSEDESASPGSDQGGSQERLEGVPNVSESSNPVPVVTDPEPKPPWSGELQTLNESNLKVSTKSSNKLPINPALLGLVCPQCCKPPPAPPRAGTCKFTHHSKVIKLYICIILVNLPQFVFRAYGGLIEYALPLVYNCW